MKLTDLQLLSAEKIRVHFLMTTIVTGLFN